MDVGLPLKAVIPSLPNVNFSGTMYSLVVAPSVSGRKGNLGIYDMR